MLSASFSNPVVPFTTFRSHLKSNPESLVTTFHS
jgi:hypothetical protein